MLIPDVIGFRLTGALPEGATATDLVLVVTQMLRKHGVVNKFVEFYGPGLDAMSLPDRATLLHATKGRGRIGNDASIETDHAGFDLCGAG